MRIQNILGSNSWLKGAVIAGSVLFFATLCVGTSLTKRPWSDEGWFAAAGYNLAVHGNTGTLVIEPRGFRTGIDRYTYWTAPLYYPLQAAWYSVFGFSLFSMRMLSALFGIIFVLCWFYIAKSIFKDYLIAVLVLILLATDYLVVNVSSFGRMDIICSGLGSFALASYLYFRERNLSKAIVISQTFVVLSGLTHFLGLIYFIILMVTVLVYDRKSVRKKHFILAGLPYLFGAVGWGAYIIQDPSNFYSQFFGNAREGNRMSGFSAPLFALVSEVKNRYFTAYGLGDHSAGSSGPVFLKSLVLLAYILAIGSVLGVRDLRQRFEIKFTLGLLLLVFVVMAILDGQKLSYYLVNIIPLFTLLLSVVVTYLFSKRGILRIAVVCSVFGLILLQVGGLALRMRANPYARSFEEAANFLKARSDERTIVMASAEMAFSLGFDGQVVDDHWLGYGTGKKPDFFVLEEVYDDALDGKRRQKPEVYDFVINTLSKEYALVYDYANYRIYQRSR